MMHMKLKKHLRLLLSMLLMSVILLTGCSPVVEEIAADVITSIVESEYEAVTEDITVEDEELPVLEDTYSDEIAAEDSAVIVENETSTEDTEADIIEDMLADTDDSAGAATENDASADSAESSDTFADAADESAPAISEDGTYTTKEDVAAYLHEYGHLPSNFITKKEAKKLGWVSSEGNLDEVAPGMSIGGDYFGNYEGNLPKAKGRDYYECDIDFDGTYRNAKRIVYSDDGLIYYTEDHYETFELLYGEE